MTHRPQVVDASSPTTPRHPRWLVIGFWACIVISVAVVIRRIATLTQPLSPGPPQMLQLDRFFAAHAALTLAHIIPALAFVTLVPLFYLRRFSQAPWLRSALLLIGVIVGITAYAMSIDAVGGWVERTAVLFFNTLFLISLLRSYLIMRRGDLYQARQWMTRAISILLGIATTRPVMGVFFATSPLTHLGPKDFFGFAFWIGFSINTLVVELWLRRFTTVPHTERLAPRPQH